MTDILYVEDNEEIGRWVISELEDAGYKTEWLMDGEQAMEKSNGADIIILDVMLPGLDGFSLGQRLKDKNPEKPVLMLTARTAIEDKVQGLTFADDYVTKPFHPKELIARIEALIRRSTRPANEKLNLQHLDVYPQENRIIDTNSEEEILLTGKEFNLFFYLIENPNQILTKEQIYEAVWGEQYLEGDKSLMVHVRHLREKIEKNPGEPTIIQTIRGIGYRVSL